MSVEMAKETKRDSLTDLDIAHYLHSKRSSKSRDVDNGTSARITNNIGLWVAQPNRFDIQGVDTVKGRNPNPRINPKAKGVIKKRYGVQVD